MAGAGTHLHRILRDHFRQDFRQGCGCGAVMRAMDTHGPAWCRQPKVMATISRKMRKEAEKRGFWCWLAASIPGIEFPLQRIILLAIAAAEKDAEDGVP